MDTKALAKWLYENLPGERVALIDDPAWIPECGKCHDNVARWIAENPDYAAIRGWLDVSYQVTPNRRQFASHSIVADPAGHLFDVSLSASDGAHPFIRHPWDEVEFMAAVRDNGLPTINHLLGPDTPIAMESPTEEEWPSRQF